MIREQVQEDRVSGADTNVSSYHAKKKDKREPATKIGWYTIATNCIEVQRDYLLKEKEATSLTFVENSASMSVVRPDEHAIYAKVRCNWETDKFIGALTTYFTLMSFRPKYKKDFYGGSTGGGGAWGDAPMKGIQYSAMMKRKAGSFSTQPMYKQFAKIQHKAGLDAKAKRRGGEPSRASFQQKQRIVKNKLSSLGYDKSLEAVRAHLSAKQDPMPMSKHVPLAAKHAKDLNLNL